MSVVDFARVSRWGSFYVAAWRARSMWKWKGAVIANGLGQPLLYLASIGIGIGTVVDSRGGNGIDGVAYLVFLGPALLAAAAIMGGLEETTWPVLEGFVWGKQFRAIGATAVTNRQLALGVYWVSALRTVVTVVLYWAVLLGFHAVHLRTSLALMALCIYAGLAGSALMFWISIHIRNDDAFMALFYRFALMPLFLFSGTFYPLSMLTIWIRWVGWISPIWHATELGRWISYGHSLSGQAIALHFGYLTAMLIVGMWLALRSFEERMGR